MDTIRTNFCSKKCATAKRHIHIKVISQYTDFRMNKYAGICGEFKENLNYFIQNNNFKLSELVFV